MSTTIDREEIQREALSRAVGNLSMSNYPDIYRGFMERGLAFEEIEPRRNVFTYNAWRALGRTVRRGEHGVKITTWIPTEKEEKGPDGAVKRVTKTYPRTAVVFHVSQTEPLEG